MPKVLTPSNEFNLTPHCLGGTQKLTHKVWQTCIAWFEVQLWTHGIGGQCGSEYNYWIERKRNPDLWGFKFRLVIRMEAVQTFISFWCGLARGYHIHKWLHMQWMCLTWGYFLFLSVALCVLNVELIWVFLGSKRWTLLGALGCECRVGVIFPRWRRAHRPLLYPGKNWSSRIWSVLLGPMP